MFCEDYEILICKLCRRNLLNMNFRRDWVSFRKKKGKYCRIKKYFIYLLLNYEKCRSMYNLLCMIMWDFII